MYCGKCGKDLNGNEYRCPSCGAEPDYASAIKLALEGNERGFSFLYEISYKSKLYIAMKYMKDEDRALDVLQDSYIKAFAKLDTLREPKTFPKWLGTIVASTALDALKKKNPVLFTDLQNEDEGGEAYEYTIADEDMSRQPEMACTAKETQEMVRELINSLSDEQRMCILMFHVEGYSIKEISAFLGCSENTVKSRLNYGRQSIKAKAEELQKRGYKLYSYTPITLLLYLIWSDMRAELASGTLAQIAGTTCAAGKTILQKAIVSSGRAFGSGAVMGGGAPGGAQGMTENSGGAASGGAQGMPGNSGGAASGGAQGMPGNPGGAVSGGTGKVLSTASNSVAKKTFFSTLGGKIAVIVAGVAVVGAVAIGIVTAKNKSDDKENEQVSTTEAVALNDDTASASGESSQDITTATNVTTEAQVTEISTETTEISTETTEEVTTEAAVDESAYKAAYKKVLKSYKTQVTNYFWQYDYDVMAQTAKEEQTPIAFADVTGDGVPEMILIQTQAPDSSGDADLDIYSFDGDKAIQIFGTDLRDDMMAWDVNAASGTSYFLFTDKDGTLCAYRGFGDESYTDKYMKFKMDASGMLQIDLEWSKTKGPNEDYTENIVTYRKDGNEVSEAKYDKFLNNLKKKADTLLIFNEQGRDKAAEFFGNTDDTAMTYDEAMKFLGEGSSSAKSGKKDSSAKGDYKSAYLNVLEENETAIANYDIQYPVSDNEFSSAYLAKTDVHAGRESEPVAFADITGDGVPEMFVMACPDGKNSVDASPELYIYSYSDGEVKNIYDKTKVEYAPEWDLNTEYFIFKEKGDDSLYVFSIMPGANAWEGYEQYVMGKDGYLEKIHEWGIGRNNEDANATADDAIAICDGKKMNKADYDAMKENWWKSAETLILYNGDGESKIKGDESGLLEKSANMTYVEAVEYLKSA